jgi:hypothetical protein
VATEEAGDGRRGASAEWNVEENEQARREKRRKCSINDKLTLHVRGDIGVRFSRSVGVEAFKTPKIKV